MKNAECKEQRAKERKVAELIALRPKMIYLIPVVGYQNCADKDVIAQAKKWFYSCPTMSSIQLNEAKHVVDF